MNVIDHARKYIDAAPGAVSGQGGHNQTLAVACSLVKGFNFSIAEARPLLQEYNERCNPKWSDAELEHKLQAADSLPDTDKFGVSRPRGWLRNDNADKFKNQPPPRDVDLPTTPPPKPSFKETRLQKFAAPYREFIDTAWLANRSPVNPYGCSTDDFLKALYKPGENVLIFTDENSQGQFLWPKSPPPIPDRSDRGVWFLCQPVDGERHENPRQLDKDNKPKLSRRSEESVTSFRYMVIESDKAKARDWIAALVQLPLCISAIYTSGGRSIHALMRVDAPSIHEWRSFSKQLQPILTRFGADSQVVATAVRLTRLPGCFRGDNLQKLLYLNPDPQPFPIVTQQPRRDVLSDVFATAKAMLETSAGEILAAAKPKSLDDCIHALERHEKLRGGGDPAECLRALKWFESSKAARELLARLNKRR